MFQDPLALLAIFDDLHNTRDELKGVEASLIEKATSVEASAASVEQSAARIEEAVQQWKEEIEEIGTKIGRHVHDNGYIALEKYVDDLHERAITEIREIAATSRMLLQQVTTTATTEWRSLSANQVENFHRHLQDIAAAANGLPPLPPRPIAGSFFSSCVYSMKLVIIRARRFSIEMKSFAILVLALASVISTPALLFIAVQVAHGPFSFFSAPFR